MGGVGLWYAVWCWYVMHAVMAWLLIQVSTPVHRSEGCWTEGDAGGSKDFVLHTLQSTRDYDVQYPLVASLFLFEMFNDHRLHHLFPTLDLSLMKEIRPVFEQFCAEKGWAHMVQRQDSFWEVTRALYRGYCNA